MPTHHLVQKLSDRADLPLVLLPTILKKSQSRRWHDDPINLWEVTDVHSNLFHHTGWYWYRFQLYFWRLHVTLLLALFVILNIFIDISSYIMPKKYLCNLFIRSVFPLCEAIALECSQSSISWCTSLIISIWRSLSLII